MSCMKFAGRVPAGSERTTGLQSGAWIPFRGGVSHPMDQVVLQPSLGKPVRGNSGAMPVASWYLL